MNIQLKELVVRNRKSIEQITFSESVTFIYGPVSTGKSTVARLVDFCLGGELENTPAIQQEFISTELFLLLGNNDCRIERAIDDTQSVRVSWRTEFENTYSINAPLRAQESPLLNDDIFNLSDLLFHLCGAIPIKVRKRSRDPESPLVRLSFRDIWTFCYLDQSHLDSSFFKLEDPFRGRKSQDAMRFFTGLHSEKLSQLENDLLTYIDEQRSKREAVKQIRSFMERFGLGSESDISNQLDIVQNELESLKSSKIELEKERSVNLHPSDGMRDQLRDISNEIDTIKQSVSDLHEALHEQISLKAELITAKTKASRSEKASELLKDVYYNFCPQCGTDIEERVIPENTCGLCQSNLQIQSEKDPIELEALRRDLNDRIDQIEESIARRNIAKEKLVRDLKNKIDIKEDLDKQLQDSLSRYDSAFLERIREVDRKIAMLTERLSSLNKLRQMPQAINNLEEEAGALQGRIDRIRSLIEEEKSTLKLADKYIKSISEEFKDIMIRVGFPGVNETDHIVLDPKNWKPKVHHGDQLWDFWDAGSGGKKTLFNICYSIAIHRVAVKHKLPVPSLLIIDSPTKNISEDENPELVKSLYSEIYNFARISNGNQIQFLLIDSDLVKPENESEFPNFKVRRMAGTEEDPSLISYYLGP